MYSLRRFFRTSEDNESQNTKDGLILLLCRIIILGTVIMYLIKSFTGTYYHEIDSYVLPTISIEYRHSMMITQADIDQAQIDFPQYYEDVNDFDSLRSSQLNKITEDKWLAYYFPSYSICCMPLKLLFQLLGADQAWAFTVTNALFAIAALIYMYSRLKVPPIFKLLAVLLFVISPLDLYIQYISSETMMFSLVIISLVMYINGKYRTSAVTICIASMTNPTVMGFGIVMVAEYLIKMFIRRKEVRIFSRQNIIDTLKYACCFIPCFIPFVFNMVAMGQANPTSGGATLEDYGARVLSYLFDVNIGFSTLAPVTLLAFFALVIISLVKKDLSALRYLGFLMTPLLAYSLMIYMNCVPVFFSRYVMWNYPALIIGTAVLASNIISSPVRQYIFSGVITASTAAMLCINSIPMYYFSFNTASRFLLENCPQLYIPYHGTFYAGTDGYCWGCETECPSLYFSQSDGALRKCLFKATDEYKKQVISRVSGSSGDIDKFTEMVNSVPSDGNYHYIDIPRSSGIKLWEKTSEEYGYFRESKELLNFTEGLTVIKSSNSFRVDTEKSESYTLHKLEMYFDSGDLPQPSAHFMITAFGTSYLQDQMMITSDNKITLMYQANEIYNPEISFYSEKEVRIKAFRVTQMQETSPDILTNSPVVLPPDNRDGILVAAEYDPMKFYFLDVTLPENSISDTDNVYCMLYYKKRFNQIQPIYKLKSGHNRILVNSGDTTIVQPYPNNGFYIKFFGSSQNQIEIEYIALNIAQ